ncbi:glutathione S-transferase [Mytilus galloprovincialis]|uniref:Glutathione S-transferase n=1 Tax=Mytilus galloprovincialis TaxID=29158 RepID=A0A8B6FPI0_MYTGA|nr:glutathione S-transferase [Mytilus galloprovincialis]
MPVLTVDGTMINQSGAISRYLAREFGLYGKTNIENTTCDIFLETINDVIQDMMKYYYAQDETKKAEAFKSVQDNTIPKFLKYITTILEGNGNTYLVGSELTVADIAVFDILDRFIADPTTYPGFLNAYSAVQSLVERVKTVPNIKKYLDGRPSDG